MFRLGTLFLVLSDYIQGNSGGLQKTQFIKRGKFLHCLNGSINPIPFHPFLVDIPEDKSAF